jgi:ribosomal protein S18 acetylase RimI-like enzyme
MTTLRPYAGIRDLPTVIELLIECQIAGYVDMEFRSIELRMFLNDPVLDTQRRTLLIEDNATLLAFGVLWGGRFLGTLVKPTARGTQEPRLVAWATEQASAQGLERVGALCRDDDTFGVNLLRGMGFTTLDTELRMSRRLAVPLPEPLLPAGFSIRLLDPARELDDWLALYATTIGAREHILRKWRAYRADPDYRRDLDLVAVDADGRLAGACTCTIAREEMERLPLKEGRTEPIMVRADCQGHGLGTPLIISGLHALCERGMDVASLTTESDNPRAHKLYQSLGFRTRFHALWMERAI